MNESEATLDQNRAEKVLVLVVTAVTFYDASQGGRSGACQGKPISFFCGHV